MEHFKQGQNRSRIDGVLPKKMLAGNICSLIIWNRSTCGLLGFARGFISDQVKVCKLSFMKGRRKTPVVGL